MWKLRFHFAIYAYVSEAAWAVYFFRRGDFSNVVLHFFRAFLQTVGFHLALKLRAVIGRLPVEDLDKFLVDISNRPESGRRLPVPASVVMKRRSGELIVGCGWRHCVTAYSAYSLHRRRPPMVFGRSVGFMLW